MASFRVETPQRSYDAIVERGAVRRIPDFLPAKHGKIFVVTTKDVWDLHASCFAQIPQRAYTGPSGQSVTSTRLAVGRAIQYRHESRTLDRILCGAVPFSFQPIIRQPQAAECERRQVETTGPADPQEGHG